MTYSPQSKNKAPMLLSIAFAVVSVSCFFCAGYLPSATWVLQLAFVCFATVSIQILLKYVLTKYEYKCDDDSLYIYKSLGKKSLLIGKLELSNSASYIESYTDFSASEKDYKIKSIYDYTRNYKTTDVYSYITTIGETNFMIKLEVNNEFADYVNCKIDKIFQGDKTND